MSKLPVNALFILALGSMPPAGAWAAGPWRASAQNTEGWQYMSPNERIEYQRRMRGFQTYEQCSDYQAQHGLRIRERAGQAKGAPVPKIESACEQLRTAGKLK